MGPLTSFITKKILSIFLHSTLLYFTFMSHPLIKKKNWFTISRVMARFKTQNKKNIYNWENSKQTITEKWRLPHTTLDQCPQTSLTQFPKYPGPMLVTHAPRRVQKTPQPNEQTNKTIAVILSGFTHWSLVPCSLFITSCPKLKKFFSSP